MPGSSRSVLIGGLTGFGLCLLFAWIPLVGPAMCCAALLGTGLLSVWHHVATTGTPVASGQGARMGAQAGLVAFVASTVLLSLSWLVAGRPNLASQLRNYGNGGPVTVEVEVDADVLEMLARALDTPLVVLGMVLTSVFVYTLLGVLGGAIGAGVFRHAERPPRDRSA